MTARRPRLTWLAATLGLAAAMMLGPGRPAGAQHTPDPYNIVGEYNSQYEPYMYATYPNEGGVLPNQDRLQGRSGNRNANTFQSFLDSDGVDVEEFGRSSVPRLSGPGVPYYRANRRYDQEFQRTYRPNEMADRSFYTNQKDRNEKYFQALREPDPRKRAQLLRQYNLDNLRAARSLSNGRNATDRDREPARDRTGTGTGASMEPDESDDEPRPLTTAPPPARRPAGFAAPSAPVPRDRPGTIPPASSRVPARSPRSPAPGDRSGTSRGISDLLDRSELLDRASRATAPVVPPAPR